MVFKSAPKYLLNDFTVESTHRFIVSSQFQLRSQNVPLRHFCRSLNRICSCVVHIAIFYQHCFLHTLMISKRFCGSNLYIGRMYFLQKLLHQCHKHANTLVLASTILINFLLCLITSSSENILNPILVYWKLMKLIICESLNNC